MQQTEHLEATWSYNTGNLSFDGVELYGLDMNNDFGGLDFLPSFLSTMPHYSSEISSPDQYFSSGVSDDSNGFLEFGDNLPNLEETDMLISSKNRVIDEISCLSDLMEIDNSMYSLEVLSNKKDSVEIPSAQLSIFLPQEEIEIDIQLSICSLIKAYGEAIESGQLDLADAIVTRFEEKADPTGETFQRLVYYLVQSFDKSMDYLRQESFKIYNPVFLALYQIFPYGRFAHFLANSEIINNMSRAAEIVIVDFDIGEGLQWPPLIEFLGRKKHPCLVKLISMKWDEDNNSSPRLWKFEETKRQLCEHASYFNLKFDIVEMSMEGLVREIKTMKKTEVLAFNAMTNLPHMGRARKTSHLVEFLTIAKDAINSKESTNNGIITFGDGLMEERKKDCSGFGSFLKAQMVHFHALLDSMDLHFPLQLIEARIAMESLFIAPYMSSFACFQSWEENSFGIDDFRALGLAGRRLNKHGTAEAKELVGERVNQYWMRNGENGNEMVLGYKGNPLVKFSCWN